MHQLRHWFASALLDGGVSIKAVSEYLGHADAGFTLRTYTHLMPSSEVSARSAVSRAFGQTSEGQTEDRQAPANTKPLVKALQGAASNT